MANRIAAFFESMTDRDEAVAGVGGHIRKFWEPRMRRQLLEIAAADAGGALHPLVHAAVAEGELAAPSQ